MTVRRFGGLVAGLVLLAFVSLLSIAIGARSVPLSTVLHVLAHRDGSDAAYVVWDLRVPRTLMGILVGAALGVAGALMQALTRNPLADPGLLGVNAGAGAAAALSVSVFGITDLRAFVWLAFAGAALAGAALYVISSSASPLRLALAGSAVAAALTGVTQAVILLDRQALDQMRFWTVGSLVRADADSVRAIAPFLLVGLVIAFLLARPLNVLRLGDEVARSLGARIGRIRFFTLIAITLLAGGATAAVGPLVFVGLAVPHMVRALTGPDERWVVAYCTILSPSLLLVADVIGRVIARSEIDVGVVTALLGGPVFLYLIRKSGART